MPPGPTERSRKKLLHAEQPVLGGHRHGHTQDDIRAWAAQRAFSVTFDITQCDWRYGSLAEPGAP
jgi:hypothetical protein